MDDKIAPASPVDDADTMQAAAQGTNSYEFVPPLGYRNYWYPGTESRLVRRAPLHLKLLGDDVVLFRDAGNNDVIAMHDRCQHRNGSLALGKSYYPGTITCPYHGWTFDRTGRLTAVLSEGPSCPLTGRVRQRIYPTREFRGFVWLWMGKGDAVPLESDLPPELLDSTTEIFTQIQIWKANWRQVTENTDGYHAPILHIDSMPRTLYMNWVSWRRTSFTETEDGQGVIIFETSSAAVQTYPGLGTWPVVPPWKRIAKKVLRAKIGVGREIVTTGGRKGRITEDLHLPGWRRVRVRKSTVFIEWGVPIDEHTTRHFLWDVVLRDPNLSPLRGLAFGLRVALFRYVIYPTYWRWAYNRRYVGQDQKILEHLYDGPEQLQTNDAGIVGWRRLARRARGETPAASAVARSPS